MYFFSVIRLSYILGPNCHYFQTSNGFLFVSAPSCGSSWYQYIKFHILQNSWDLLRPSNIFVFCGLRLGSFLVTGAVYKLGCIITFNFMSWMISFNFTHDHGSGDHISNPQSSNSSSPHNLTKKHFLVIYQHPRCI